MAAPIPSIPRRSMLTLLAMLLLALAGCAGTLEPSRGIGDPGEAAWYLLRFQLRPGPEGQVQRHLDAQIADRVIAPVLHEHDHAIRLWRFHRRWPDDTIGHLFSFIFLADADVAGSIEAAVGQNQEFADLLDSDDLRRFWMERRPGGIAATSDPIWPDEIARQWPAFAMGMSRTWLGLVREESAKRDGLPLDERYVAVDRALDDYWLRYAHHAFLHHLNALFGYRALRLPDGTRQRF